jgi:hypothetical protein
MKFNSTQTKQSLVTKIKKTILPDRRKAKPIPSHITRIEVHLSDENGKKEGHNDIQCILEARIEGRDPIAVRCDADTAKKCRVRCHR